jgi:hypothetical protein
MIGLAVWQISRYPRTNMRVIWVIAVVTGVVYAAAPPTFYKNVLPVLEHNCQTCHRAGEAAPMPPVLDKDTRPWVELDPMDLYRPVPKRSE